VPAAVVFFRQFGEGVLSACIVRFCRISHAW